MKTNKTLPPMPLIHLNGTGKKMLCEGYDQAAEKLQDFIDAWRSVEFNARDYYPHGTEAWRQACDARDAINAKICAIIGYIGMHREHLHGS